MNIEQVKEIANAVLFEGYLLYPYRHSAIKNRQRWTIGVVYPQEYSEAQRGYRTLHDENRMPCNRTVEYIDRRSCAVSDIYLYAPCTLLQQVQSRSRRLHRLRRMILNLQASGAWQASLANETIRRRVSSEELALTSYFTDATWLLNPCAS